MAINDVLREFAVSINMVLIEPTAWAFALDLMSIGTWEKDKQNK